MRLTSIHPFPARMAPEIILEYLENLPKRCTVLDPMCGSGTVLRGSAEGGHDAFGFDGDPLAVLMSKVWTRRIRPGLSDAAFKLASDIYQGTDEIPDCHASCPETFSFARFWFEEKQYRQLSALSSRLLGRNDEFADALRLALSRVIITKEKGASIARDTSHSRPHRVFKNNDFDVARNFVIAARRIEERLKSDLLYGTCRVQSGDARNLPLAAESIDAVLTSPPYLNAIDYMRGHRLALIWLGFKLGELRKVRSEAIGAERGANRTTAGIECKLPELTRLSNRDRNIVQRYTDDIAALMMEIRRVLRPGGQVLIVIGNSMINDVSISNADISVVGARRAGLKFGRRFERALPTQSRYLPITGGTGALSKRLRTETILIFHA